MYVVDDASRLRTTRFHRIRGFERICIVFSKRRKQEQPSSPNRHCGPAHAATVVEFFVNIPDFLRHTLCSFQPKHSKHLINHQETQDLCPFSRGYCFDMDQSRLRQTVPVRRPSSHRVLLPACHQWISLTPSHIHISQIRHMGTLHCMKHFLHTRWFNCTESHACTAHYTNLHCTMQEQVA